LSFGGGGSGGGGVTAHMHNALTGEGGPLKANTSTTTGTSIQFLGNPEVPIEALM
jgi:hypothetical protein